jgi:hypothetical protein
MYVFQIESATRDCLLVDCVFACVDTLEMQLALRAQLISQFPKVAWLDVCAKTDLLEASSTAGNLVP